MSFMSRLIAKIYKLPPADTYAIAIEKKLEIPINDGVILRADRYYPCSRQNIPTVLDRTPYGRTGYGASMGVPIAERGFQVLVQSCRGSDDSGGEINAFRGEREDGLATIDLWPTARRIKPGHSIRVQVSSGAFPRFARNLGTGEPLATGIDMRAAEQQVFHDSTHPSAIILPVFLRMFE